MAAIIDIFSPLYHLKSVVLLIEPKILPGGNPESAAQLLEKAAKILESKSPEEALSLYSKAAETVGTEDRPKEASEYMAKVAKLQVC